MKQRDFKLDAWELCRRMGCPGDVALAEAAMKFGYSVCLKDCKERLAQVNDEINTKRIKNNFPT